MAVRGDEAAARTERARAIELFRYQLIREAADPALSPKARGRLVRQIATEELTVLWDLRPLKARGSMVAINWQ